MAPTQCLFPHEITNVLSVTSYPPNSKCLYPALHGSETVSISLLHPYEIHELTSNIVDSTLHGSKAEFTPHKKQKCIDNHELTSNSVDSSLHGGDAVSISRIPHDLRGRLVSPFVARRFKGHDARGANCQHWGTNAQ